MVSMRSDDDDDPSSKKQRRQSCGVWHRTLLVMVLFSVPIVANVMRHTDTNVFASDDNYDRQQHYQQHSNNNDDQQHTTTSSRSTRKTENTKIRRLADTIVQTSYERTYRLLQTGCEDTNVSLKDCLKQLYRHKFKRRHIPWWFKTLMRDSLDTKNAVFQPWHVLKSTVDPRVQMCVMGKVATTQWRKVFCRLDQPANPSVKCFGKYSDDDEYDDDEEEDEEGENDEEEEDEGGDEEEEERRHRHRALRRKQDDYDDNESQQVRKFVFFRDPLERFLSAFLDKCVGKHMQTEYHCEPLLLFKNPMGAKFRKGLKEDDRVYFEAYVDTMPLRWNMHFIPMGLFCDGIFRHVNQYDFIGNMGTDFYHDINDVGKRYGQKMMDAVDEVFDVTNKVDEINHGVETSASTRVEDYYTPRTVRRVLEYLSIDYVTLNLPIPEWAHRMLEEEEEEGSELIGTER